MLYGFYLKKELKKLKDFELYLFPVSNKPIIDILRPIPKKVDGGTSVSVEQ